MKKQTFRIGTDDFRELREDNGYFVDKSLLIRAVLDVGKVTLLPRPRRFGKTLNLSMLRYFFEASEEDRRPLFEGLAITDDAEAMTHFGRYPVVHLSLKDIKGNSWEEARSRLLVRIGELFLNAKEIRDTLSPLHEPIFDRLACGQSTDAELKESLKYLIDWLNACHGEPVIVLIDEYDSPVIEAWNKGYYDEMIDFIRSWLGGGLKHENGPALFRAVVTGILRVAKESVFSGLNNLKVCTVLRADAFADKFGFTQSEVDQLIVQFELGELGDEIREWYNGYNFGGVTIYNPWSVINAIDSRPALLGPHWLNTASNHLIFAELEAGGLELKRDLETLLGGGELRYPVIEHTTFDDIGKNPANVWSFLLFAGYLKAEDPQRNALQEITWRLSIPNLEVSAAYREFVEHWHQTLRFNGTRSLLEALLGEDYGELERLLNELIRNLVSLHDVARYPEAAYHALVLGLLANLRAVYEIRSNPESGYGRADILMVPKTTTYPLAFVIEFKVVKADGDLAAAADAALAQIAARGYEAALDEADVPAANRRRLAIAIAGKRCSVKPAG